MSDGFRSGICRCVPLEWPPLPGRRGKTIRTLLLAAGTALGAFALVPQSAMADLLAPDSPASPQADASWTAYVVFVVITLIAALAVIAALLRAVRGGRSGTEAEPERRTRGTVGVQRRVGFGLGAAALVLFIVGVFFTESAREVEASASGEPITIQVDGQQWVWRYEYPEAADTSDGYAAETPFSFYELVVPVDTPITLDVSSVDVRHRWWVPALGRAVDAVPGEGNEFTFVADEVGTYEGRSTEYSGPGYSTMRTIVRVVEQAEYETYLEERIADIDAARESVEEAVAEDAGASE